MAYVFISYRHDDRAFAQDVRLRLRRAGHEVFLDEDIRGGQQWRQRLRDELRRADVVVPLVTPEFMSAECVAEVAIAAELGKMIVPIAAGGDPRKVPFLEPVQYIDWDTGPDAAVAELAGAIAVLEHGGDLAAPAGAGSPFPGLRPYDSDLAWAFFGRSRESERVVEALRAAARTGRNELVVIVGPSGCGKSSLARAGVLPRMRREPGWFALPPVVPGHDLAGALCEAFATAGPGTMAEPAGDASDAGVPQPWTAADVRRRLDAGDGDHLVADVLAAAPPNHRTRLLVVLDQAEEALTAPGPELSDLLEKLKTAPVSFLATLRSEFLADLQSVPDLPDIRLCLLAPLGTAALESVIEGPARRAGIGVDDRLVARLVRDTGSGDALPLLAFTLAKLADGVPPGGSLDMRRYTELGGVAGALVGQADAALRDRVVVGRRRADVLGSLLQLVAVDDESRPTRLRREWLRLPEAVRADLEAFVARRLLTVYERDRRSLITVNHEAFLTRWPPLAEAIKAEESFLRTRQTTERAAAEWEAAGRPPSHLWDGARVLRALPPSSPASGGGGSSGASGGGTAGLSVLTPIAREFLTASVRSHRRRRLRARSAVGAVLAVVVVLATVAFAQRRSALEGQCVARGEQLIQQAQALRDTRPLLALDLSVMAYRGSCRSTKAAGNLLGVQDLYFATVLPASRGPVEAVDVSRGDVLAAADSSGTLRLRDMRTGRERAPRHAGALHAVAFSPDGARVAAGGEGGDVAVWDVRSARVLATLRGGREPVDGVAFSPDGSRLAVGGQDGTVRVWDVAAGRVAVTLHTGGQPVNGVSFSPDGSTVAAAGADTRVWLWDAGGRRPGRALTGHTGPVRAVAFSPVGSVLASGSDDGSVRLWDTAHDRPVATLTAHADSVRVLAFTPDGGVLATGGDDSSVFVWGMRTHARLRSLAGPAGSVTALAFTGDGHTLVGGGSDARLGTWNVGGEDDDAGSGVSTVAFGPPGTDLLAVAAAGRPVVLWDTRRRGLPRSVGSAQATTGNEGSGAGLTQPAPADIGPEIAFGVAFSPDGQLLAAPEPGSRVGVWRVSDGRRVASLPGHTGAVYALAFSSEKLASGSADSTVVLWDTSDLSAVPVTRRDHFGPVRALAFSPGGDQLATGSDDGTVGLIDLRTSTRNVLYGHLPPVEALAFSPDGTLLASGSQDRTVTVSRADDPSDRPVATLGGHSQAVVSVAFSPDGKRLASASTDGTVVIRDVGSYAVEATFTTGAGASTIAFSPDGRTLATADRDGTPVLWDVDPDRVAATLCAGRPTMSRADWLRYVPDRKVGRVCP